MKYFHYTALKYFLQLGGINMKGLSDYQKFKVIRPLPDGWPKDEEGIPFIKRDDFNDIDWNKVKFVGLSNLTAIKDKRNYLLLMFNSDYILEKV